MTGKGPKGVVKKDKPSKDEGKPSKVKVVKGYMRDTLCSVMKSDKNVKNRKHLAELSDDEDDDMNRPYSVVGGTPSGSAMRYDTGGKPTYASAAAKKPTFSDSPQGSVTSRASAGFTKEEGTADGLVSQTALRRLSTPGRGVIETDDKPKEPMIVNEYGKVKVGCKVKVKHFMEKGVVRWIGVFDDDVIAGLEMDRAKEMYNDKYDDRSWFEGPASRVHYVECEWLELMEPETTIPKSYEKSMYRTNSSAENHPHIVEQEETNDGRIRVGMRVKIRHCDHVGTVRWIGQDFKDEWVGLEMDEERGSAVGKEKLFGSAWFECPSRRERYEFASRVEPLPYEEFSTNSLPRNSVDYRTRDEYDYRRSSSTYSGHHHAVSSSLHRRAVVVRHVDRFGDFKLYDQVIYKGGYYPYEMRLGEIKFIGQTSDKVYVGLDMYDFTSSGSANSIFEDDPQFTPTNCTLGCAVYCDVREVARLEDVRKDSSSSLLGDDTRGRYDRKGSDSRSRGHPDPIKEEPSSEEASPEVADQDLYGSPQMNRHTRHPQRSPTRPESIDLKSPPRTRSSKDSSLTNGTYHDRPRTRSGTSRSNSASYARVEQGPEMKRPPLKDVSRVRQVGQYKGLEVNAMVETTGQRRFYGVIRWMGFPPEWKTEVPLVGLEMEEDSYIDRAGDDEQGYGIYDGYRLFECKSGRGKFFNADRLQKDSRFDDEEKIEPGNVDSEIVQEDQLLPVFDHSMSGPFKGIQGHHNSCYLDSTLYSMFAFTQVFDSVLHRPKVEDDIEQYTQIQTLLREKIVNPLRRDHYVDAEKVMELRKLLDELSTVTGMTGEEKDPEEFLNSLLLETLKAEPFIKLSSGQSSFLYQLFMEKQDKLDSPTVQQLVDLSFRHSAVKLKEVPPCLILQMPRFGRAYKMFERILPSSTLNITPYLEPADHKCAMCQKDKASCWWVCKDCTSEHQRHMEYCHACYRLHQKNSRTSNHVCQCVDSDKDEQIMELFSVVCIETSHYVSFTKCGPDQWVFFDSMADRKGERHGYNIPEVSQCMDIAQTDFLLANAQDSLVKRVLQDAYLCFYRSPMAEMYC